MPEKKADIYIDEFDYPLLDERIAKFPLEKRDSSKLLLYRGGEIAEAKFSMLADYLPESSLLVYNNTRVIQARLIFRKETSARIEIFCLSPQDPADYALSLGATEHCVWKCMIGNLKKWKSGVLKKSVLVEGRECVLSAERIASEEGMHSVRFSWDNSTLHFAELLEALGELPIPPYLNRATEESDKENYQTIYSKIKGSVAAPTAGLHFTDDVFASLLKKNIETEALTLHVGAGTFQPVKAQNVDDHRMHEELIEVRLATIEHLIAKIDRIIAVGTTSVRTLESLFFIGVGLIEKSESNLFYVSQKLPYEREFTVSSKESFEAIRSYLIENNLDCLYASTRIMIKPGYKFRVVKGVITNFHQPKSTLLLLVSAFVNGDWRRIYDYADSHDFRFLSYGDSSLLLP